MSVQRDLFSAGRVGKNARAARELLVILALLGLQPGCSSETGPSAGPQQAEATRPTASSRAETTQVGSPASLDQLDSARIPAAERYDWQPKELVAVIGTHRGRSWDPGCYSVAYRPDGKWVASAHEDAVRIWDAASFRQVAVLEEGMVRSLAFSADGTKLAFGRFQGAPELWEVGQLPPRRLARLMPAMLPDERMRAGFMIEETASEPSPLGEQTEPGRPMPTWRPHEESTPWPGAISLIAFSPDGSHLAFCGRQTRVFLWNMAGPVPTELPPLQGAEGPFAFSPDGKMLATAYTLWDITGNPPQGTSHYDSMQESMQKELEDGFMSYSPGEMLSMALSPDGKTLACGFNSMNAMRDDVRDVLLWDLSSGQPKLKAAIGQFKRDSLFSRTPAIAFSPDGKTLAFADRNRQVQLWDVSGSEPGKQPSQDNLDFSLPRDEAPPGLGFPRVGEGTAVRKTVLEEPVSQVGSLAFSPDGKRLVAGGDDQIQAWDLSGSEPKTLLTDPPLRIVALTATGQLLAVRNKRVAQEDDFFSQAERTVLRWDVTGAAPRELEPLGLPGPVVHLSGDGTSVVALAGDPRTGFRPELWNTSGSKPKKRFDLPAGWPVAWSQNAAAMLVVQPAGEGTEEASPYADKPLQLWDLSGTEPELRLEIQGGGDLIALAPNGQKLITKSPDPMMADYLGRYQQRAEGQKSVTKKPDPSEPAVQLWDVSGSKPERLGALDGQPRSTVIREVSTEDRADGRSIEHVSERPGPVAPPTYDGSAALSADGRWAALGCSQGDVDLWDLSGSKPKQAALLQGGRSSRPIAFSRDGRLVAALCRPAEEVPWRTRIVVWNVPGGEEVYRWDSPTPAQVFFAPDSEHLILLNGNGTVYILRLPPE